MTNFEFQWRLTLPAPPSDAHGWPVLEHMSSWRHLQQSTGPQPADIFGGIKWL